MLGLIIGIASILTALYIFYSFSTERPRTDHEYAAGTVLESRIVLDHGRETNTGSIGYYRIEIRVRYQRYGQIREVWMPSSEITSDKGLLTLRLANSHGNCEVHWSSFRPDSPECTLE
jgi:hypothetical protein